MVTSARSLISSIDLPELRRVEPDSVLRLQKVLWSSTAARFRLPIEWAAVLRVTLSVAASPGPGGEWMRPEEKKKDFDYR